MRPNNEVVFVNPDSGNTHKELGLPVEHIHLAHGSGTFGIDFSNRQTVQFVEEQGLRILCSLWEFTAKKGTKAAVLGFLKETLGYKEQSVSRHEFAIIAPA